MRKDTVVRRKSGFTLIELMIVVSVIAIIAAIAIPNLLRARMNANEGGAISSMRTIATSEVAYRTAAFRDVNGDGDGDYGTLINLNAPAPGVQGFIDQNLASGIKQGYSFLAVPTDGDHANPPTFICNSDPLTPGRTGDRHFFVDDSGVLRFAWGGPAGPGDSPL